MRCSTEYTGSAAVIATCASSPVPISLLLRASSRAFSTSSRTERRVVQSSSDFAIRRTHSRTPQNIGRARKLCHVHAVRASLNFGQILPDFFTSEAHDRRQQARQRLADAPDRGLRAAPRLRFRREDVEPVLQHVEIKRAQVDNAEMIQPVIDPVECKIVIRTCEHHQRKPLSAAACTDRAVPSDQTEPHPSPDRSLQMLPRM